MKLHEIQKSENIFSGHAKCYMTLIIPKTIFPSCNFSGANGNFMRSCLKTPID